MSTVLEPRSNPVDVAISKGDPFPVNFLVLCLFQPFCLFFLDDPRDTDAGTLMGRHPFAHCSWAPRCPVISAVSSCGFLQWSSFAAEKGFFDEGW